MYWFWRIVSIGLALFVAWLVNPISWGMCGAQENPEFCIIIRVLIFGVTYFILVSIGKKKKS